MNTGLIDTLKIYIAAFLSIGLTKTTVNELLTIILISLTCIYTIYKIVQIHKEVTKKVKQKKKEDEKIK